MVFNFNNNLPGESLQVSAGRCWTASWNTAGDITERGLFAGRCGEKASSLD